MNDDYRTVSELGEARLLEMVAARIGPPTGDEIWAGDDAAVIELPRGRALFTTDVLVEGIDFDLGYCSGPDVGWKALAVNASDIAAMGGRPTHAVTAVSMPPDTPVTLFETILDGFVAAATEWSIKLVGGDLSAARNMALDVTMLGEPHARGPVTRSGASPGDVIGVTGSLGGAAAGLRMLRAGAHPARGRAAEGPDLAAARARHLRPQARVAEAEVLCSAGVTAMIDLSDGLAIDLDRLLSASGVGCEIDTVPIDPALGALGLEGESALDTALLGGEDFELLFTIPADRFADAAAAVEALGTPCTALGSATAGKRSIMGGPIERWSERGWDHFRKR